MITVIINGEKTQFATQPTVEAALIAQGYQLGDMLGVAINQQFVPKTQWQQHSLHENDQMDVLKPISGG